MSGIVVTGGGALRFALVVWGLHWTRRDLRVDVDEFVRAFDHALGRKG